MLNVKPYHIQSIVKDAGFGGTCPIIVRANDKEYVLKTRKDGTNPKDLGVFNELLSYQLIDYFAMNIAPQEIVYLFIDENFIEMAEIAYAGGVIKQESLDYIRESEGFNIGVEYLHYAMEPLDGEIKNDSFIKKLVHIDNYVMNCDRARDNINILQDKSDQRKYYAIDFGNALVDGALYQKILDGDTDLLTTGVFENCNVTQSRRYVLKADTERLVKRGRRNKEDISTIRNNLEEIVDEFPPDWEPLEYKNVILNIIASRLKSKEIFKIGVGNKCQCLY
jgi:hypothetical protein